MDFLITIAFLALYYILGLGTVITLKTGLEEDVELECYRAHYNKLIFHFSGKIKEVLA